LLGYLSLGGLCLFGAGWGLNRGLGWGAALAYGLLLGGLLWLTRKQWRPRRKATSWQAIDWGLAAAAPLGRLRKWPWRLLSGRKPTRKRRRQARRYLRQEWDLRRTEQWLETAEWLVETGHRMAFQAEIDRVMAMDEATLAAHLVAIDRGEVEPLQDETPTEQLARIHWVRQAGPSLPAHSYLAWDLLRLIDLCRWGVLARLIDEETAVRYLLTAGQALQQRYRSWGEMYRQYLHGWRYWSQPAYEAGQAALTDQINWCQQHRRSPWRQIPWELPLQPAPAESPAPGTQAQGTMEGESGQT
jgi:hypothetical protein